MIFLGHVLSASEISADPEKVDKVKDWLVTKIIKELHSFPRLMLCYWRFIPKFAQVAKCLHQLMHLRNEKKNKGQSKEVPEFNKIKNEKGSLYGHLNSRLPLIS